MLRSNFTAFFLLSSGTRAAIHHYEEHNGHNGTYKKIINELKVENSFINSTHSFLQCSNIYRSAFSPLLMLNIRLHTVGLLSCVRWQQCMPALLLLPAYYTESSNIPSVLPCCMPCQQHAVNKMSFNCIVGFGNC